MIPMYWPLFSSYVDQEENAILPEEKDKLGPKKKTTCILMAFQFLWPVLFWGLVEFLTLDSMKHLCPYNKYSLLAFGKGSSSSFLLPVL